MDNTRTKRFERTCRF